MVRYHQPVLLREVIEWLNIRPGKWYLDCTLGDGGHILEILKLGGNVVGLDVDPQALGRTRERLQVVGYSGQQFKVIEGNFRDLKNLVGNRKFAGILFDLGVSSLQLEDQKKGFSFIREGPLDMRMDPNLSLSAGDLIKVLNKGELYELFTKLGEEKFAKTIAANLVLARALKPIQTTKELAGLIEKIIDRKGKIHPATKIFQALRIAVNDELNALAEGLPQALESLEEGGRILVISFHSLEDRIIKNQFKRWESQKRGKILSKKPINPTGKEISTNPRSRSGKLRIFNSF